MSSRIIELRMKIRSALSKCTSSVTPRFCSLIQSKEGYRKAEEMIISYAIKNGISISACIAHLESEIG